MSLQNMSQNPTIDRLIFEGLFIKAGAYFNEVTPALISTTNVFQVLRSLRDQLAQTSPTAVFQPPFMFMKLTNLNVAFDNSTYAPRSLYRSGVVGELNSAETEYTKTPFIPVDFDFEVHYITDDLYKLISFSRKWCFLSANSGLNFSVIWNGARIDIKVSTEPQMAFPDKDMSVDTFNYYEATARLLVKGYMSPDVEFANLPKLAPLKELRLGPMLASSQDGEGTLSSSTFSYVEIPPALIFDYGLQPSEYEILTFLPKDIDNPTEVIMSTTQVD